MTVVLLIGGDAATRLAVRRALGFAGFSVFAEPVTPCGKAWGALPEPDLVIVDHIAVAHLPALRQRYPRARLLSLSGELCKPFTPSQLLAAVRRCLARPDATREARRRSPRPRTRRV